MIKIRNESDLRNWFKKNYKKLGFTKIIKHDEGKFPDFLMLEGNKKIRVELEVKSSNFILHKHPVNRVDKVVCAIKDVELEVPLIEIPNIKIIKFDKKTPFSLEEQIYNIFNKEKVLTTSEVKNILDISWNTAERGLTELLIEGKVERIKKEGVNLWIKK